MTKVKLKSIIKYQSLADRSFMKKRYVYSIATILFITLLSGFTSESNFPAPVKEPAAAIYLNLSSSGMFDEENQVACEEIAENVANICKFRNVIGNSDEDEKDYKSITINFLKESILSGFLKIQEIYFYFKNTNEFALIAKGEFDLFAIAEKSKAEMVFDDDEKLVKITTTFNSNNEKMLLQVNNDTLVICPEGSIAEINENLENNENLLGDNFKTFEKMLQYNPAISAEINLHQLIKDLENVNLPKELAVTDLVRLFIAPVQNKIQINVPEDSDREELRKELEKQTDALNSIFENKTDYRLKEGKTSLFIESKTDEEQVQAISRKATAFVLHFFVKNISSDQH